MRPASCRASATFPTRAATTATSPSASALNTSCTMLRAVARAPSMSPRFACTIASIPQRPPLVRGQGHAPRGGERQIQVAAPAAPGIHDRPEHGILQPVVLDGRRRLFGIGELARLDLRHRHVVHDPRGERFDLDLRRKLAGLPDRFASRGDRADRGFGLGDLGERLGAVIGVGDLRIRGMRTLERGRAQCRARHGPARLRWQEGRSEPRSGARQSRDR